MKWAEGGCAHCTGLSICTHTRTLALDEAGGRKRRGEGQGLRLHSCATYSVERQRRSWRGVEAHRLCLNVAVPLRGFVRQGRSLNTSVLVVSSA